MRWPLVDLALFRNRPFVVGCLSFFLFSAALFGSQPYWSLFMQNTWGFSPLQGGLGFLPATGLIVILTPLSGIIAQWIKTRLDVLLICGLVLNGLSFLYVVITMNTQRTYVDGLLPVFLTRGLAIPIVSSCITLVVMSAVSTKQSGLASGTLGMARNIGTAFGVALLSQVYLFHINTTIPASLIAGRAAADQFIVSGKGASHLIIEEIVFQGFKMTTLACSILCAVAVILIFFMRTRVRTKEIVTTVQEREEEVAV
ncbi:MAG: MFS transporter [Ktedonobacteraceae bacterium]|nr:MFS transporter [Ktedonobacteraceae bacterium]